MFPWLLFNCFADNTICFCRFTICTISCFSYAVYPLHNSANFQHGRNILFNFGPKARETPVGGRRKLSPVWLPGPEVLHSYLLPGQMSILVSVTRATCHAFLPVTRPDIYSCLCYQDQRSCILTCYQAKYPCLSLVLGPDVMHSYLLPGQISILISVTRARGHAFLPITRPNIHAYLYYQGQRSCILTYYQAKYPCLSLLPGQEVMHSYLLPGRISILAPVTQGQRSCILICY
jgi:hypothetical protein